MRSPTLPVALVVLCSGCDDAVLCTANLRASLSGEVVNEAGAPVIPDAVRVKVSDEPARLCSTGWDGTGYTCFEGPAGHAQVMVTLGDRTWTKPVRIRNDPDGCHNAFQQLDFVLDDLVACEPAVAVSGAVVGPDGGTAAGADIWLSRLIGDQPGTPTRCDVSAQGYRCIASDYYGTHDYLLVLQSDATRLEVALRIPAEDCLITPARHDFTLTALP